MALDVPEDICHATHPFEDDEFVVDPIHRSAPALRTRPDATALDTAADMIKAAERPLMLCGGGVHISRAAEAVTAFAEATNIPVAHTMSGKGSIACSHRLSAGLFGRYDRIANKMIEEADLLFVVGCKLGEIATKRYTVPPKGKTVIHLDIVAEEMGRTLMPALSLWGDAKAGLEELRAPWPAAAWRDSRTLGGAGAGADGRVAQGCRCPADLRGVADQHGAAAP